MRASAVGAPRRRPRRLHAHPVGRGGCRRQGPRSVIVVAATRAALERAGLGGPRAREAAAGGDSASCRDRRLGRSGIAGWGPTTWGYHGTEDFQAVYRLPTCLLATVASAGPSSSSDSFGFSGSGDSDESTRFDSSESLDQQLFDRQLLVGRHPHRERRRVDPLCIGLAAFLRAACGP